MKAFHSKSPQLVTFLRVLNPLRTVEVLPLNERRCEFIVTPADDQLYRDVALFSDTTTTVPLSDFLHELGQLRDRVRVTLRGGGAR